MTININYGIIFTDNIYSCQFKNKKVGYYEKFVSLIIFAIMLLNVTLPCYATSTVSSALDSFDSTNNVVMNECGFIAQSQMDRYKNNQTIAGVSEVYNTANELIAYCYNFKPYGYVIVRIADYVPQVVGPTHETPYPHDKVTGDIKYVYGGGLNFWTVDTNGTLTDIETGMQSKVDKVSNPFRVEQNNVLAQKNLKAVLNAHNANYAAANTGTEVTTTHDPEAYKNGSYLCGPIASSIVLYYLHSYCGLSIPSNVFSGYSIPCQGIAEYLLNNNYLVGRNTPGTPGMSPQNMVNGKLFSYSGLNSFLDDIGSSFTAKAKNIAPKNLSESVSEIKNSILLDYPVIVSTTSNPTSDVVSDHFYVAYGYVEYLTFTRLIVTDGYGKKGLELDALSKNIDGAVLFS